MQKKPLLFIAAMLLSTITYTTQTYATQITDSIAPEAANGYLKKSSIDANKYMVVAANPLATKAGYEVLKKGGNAIDAMIAVQTMLGLVEPQSSGLGGGAFLIYFDAATMQITTFDGRETAPQAATPELFQDKNGKPLQFYSAVVGGRSIATPGTVKLLSHLHQRYGTQPWADLLTPAKKQATKGFKVSPRLAGAIKNDAQRLSTYPDTRAYFFTSEGKPLKEGTLLKNPAYAKTLATLAKKGAEEFYTGKIAKTIIDKVQGIRDNPGLLSMQDLSNYRVKERPASCAPYRDYTICGMGPPSSGALTINQILGISSHFNLSAMGKDDPIAWQIIGDASRLAFSDRGRYIADTDFVPMPEGLLDSDYLATRAALITPGKALKNATAGKPRWEHTIEQEDDQSIELPSTSHIVIVDRQGNTASMTTTIENGFGSRVMSNGFLLNNELTDFSFASHKNGYPIANRLEPGKRPRSSMAPTIVMKDGKPYLAIGSPGGSRIIGYVTKTLIAHIDWGMPIQEAINQAHLINRFGTYDIEKNTAAERFKEPLEKMGFSVNIRELNSGLHAIKLNNGALTSGADPRREGVALGD